MKKLFLLLLISFLSLNSLAKVGDVYYCETKSYSSMSPTRGFENYATNNFKFKFEKDTIVFDNKFEPSPMKELPITFGDGRDLTVARSSEYDMPEFVVYSYGDLFYSYGGIVGVFTVIAECDMF